MKLLLSGGFDSDTFSFDIRPVWCYVSMSAKKPRSFKTVPMSGIEVPSRIPNNPEKEKEKPLWHKDSLQ